MSFYVLGCRYREEVKVMATERKRSDGISAFAKEVYCQCVEKGWTLSDFSLFVQLIELKKEAAFRVIRIQKENEPLPKDS